jgi:hypothetical protein
MKNNRRDFLKMGGLTAIGLTSSLSPAEAGDAAQAQIDQLMKDPKQTFNMSGYAAPKIDTVRIGFIGLGNRGSGAITRVNRIANVQTVAICDIRPAKIANALKALKKMDIEPITYTEKEEAWKEAKEGAAGARTCMMAGCGGGLELRMTEKMMVEQEAEMYVEPTSFRNCLDSSQHVHILNCLECPA